MIWLMKQLHHRLDNFSRASMIDDLVIAAVCLKKEGEGAYEMQMFSL